MILVLDVVFILLAIIGFILTERSDSDSVGVMGFIMGMFGAICGFLALVVTLGLGGEVIQGRFIDKKITMYQEENKAIEEQVTAAVNSYKEYEKEVINNTGEMATVLVRFPELKSNELVNKQIEVYITNNDKIKNLKLEKIDNQVYRWWLYFGN
jgi:preprotein translocase subunit SecF